MSRIPSPAAHFSTPKWQLLRLVSLMQPFTFWNYPTRWGPDDGSRKLPQIKNSMYIFLLSNSSFPESLSAPPWASSGSSFYYPSNIKLNEKVKFYIKNGHIQSVIGNEKDVCNIKRHYDYVSNKFKTKRDIVHSLHCGIHNGLLSESIKLNNPDYWSNTVFAHPNYLHFHTCGDYAPGEICWILKNQTIRVDDLNLWQNGNIMYNNFPSLMKCTDKWPELLTLLKNKPI